MTHKNKKMALLVTSSIAALVIGVFAVGTLPTDAFAFLSKNSTSENRITLDSSNKVSSSGDHIQKTAKGNDVIFLYSGVASSTGGHVTLNAEGYLENKDHIRSITSFTCTLTSGSLTAKLSYGGDSWSEGFDVISGQTYFTGSNPYYVKFIANSLTTISSVVFEYSCVDTISEHSHEVQIEGESYYQKVTSLDSVVGDYLIVYESTSSSAKIFNGGLDTLDAQYNYLTASIEDGKISVTTDIDNARFTFIEGGYILSSSGSYIYSASYSNGLNTSDTKPTDYSSSISVSDGILTVEANSGTSLRFNDASNNGQRFRFYKSGQQDICLYERVTVQGDSYIEYDIPKDCIGFTATDSKANNYKTSDVYDLVNGLSVTANYSDGSSSTLSRGLDGYSYVIKNSANVNIDSSQPFGGESDDTYKVIVSYKNFIPVEINISVGYAISLTKIEVHSSTLSFNTAQKLSDFTSGITADLTYNKVSENIKDLPCSSFASKDISLALLDPNGLTYNINDLFATAGDNWKIRVSSTSNPNIYGELIIVVNSIPVTHIDVSASSSTTLEEGSSLQLSVSVTPNNATNQNVTWESSYPGVATVDASGLVTAISSSINEGATTITATAQDGSSVFGSINITVIEKAKAADEGYYSLLSGSLEVGSYVIFASTSDNGSAYACGGQNGNIRSAEAVTIANSMIEKTSTSNFRAYLVGEGVENGSYSFFDTFEEEYLCATSSSSNYISTEKTLDANGSWTVSGTASATITAQGSYTKNTLRYNYNSGNPRFTCYGSNSTMATPAIFVKAGEITYPTSLSVSASEDSIAIGETSQLTVGYSPITTTYKKVTYSSSNTGVATVDNKGLVTGVSEGEVTITVTGYNGVENITASIKITISKVYVTGVEIVASSTTIKVGSTLSLNATISPSNATDKDVSWSSSNTDVATISDNGVVTAKAAGETTITVTTIGTASDGVTHATDSLNITVSSSSTTGTTDVIDKDETSSEIGSVYTNTWKEFTINGASGAVYSVRSMGTNGGDYALRFNANGYLYTSTSNDLIITSISVSSNNAIGIGLSNNVIEDKTGNETTTITSGTYEPSGDYKYLRIWGITSSTMVTSIEITYEAPQPVDPTAISISPDSTTLAPGNSKNLTVNYVPSTANQNLDADWSSSNSGVVSVDSSGKITANASASIGQSATITVRLHNLPSIFNTCVVTIVESTQPKQTIMIYMCGSDLESGYDSDSGKYVQANGGQGTSNLAEILSVSNQPDDVNIIVETGGSHYWYNNYGMNASKLERWHVYKKTLVKDSSLTRTNMAASSTFQSFIEWGLQYYPAERTGVIVWDHGNGMQGCCSDEYNTYWDMLTCNETKTALTNAYSNKNVSDKLEWIGYDCCLMAMQDIASINADYFNYQISSQESEPGAGWNYDEFVTPLFNNSNISTVNLLKAICDTYKTKVRETYDGYAAEDSQYAWYANFDDTTLAIFDLAYMSNYVSSWETMTSNLAINSKTKFSTLAGYAKQCYAFANVNNNGYGTGTSGVDAYDAYTFLNKIKSNYSNSGASSVQTAFNNVVIYFVVGSTYKTHAYGMSVFVATYGQTEAANEYTENDTKFTNWRNINISYGTWFTGS